MTDKRVDMAKLDDSIASRLKRVRTALELRSAEMAEYLGIGNSKYSNLETGKQVPDEALLVEIDQVLAVNGVPAGWVGGNASPEALAAVAAPTKEIWDYSSDEILSELSRRLFEAEARAEEAVPLSVLREQEKAADSPDIADYSAALEPEPPVASEAVTTVPDDVQPVEPVIAAPAPMPSFPVAPPAVDVPLPMPVAVGDVVAPLPQPVVTSTSSDPLLALIGPPATPATTGDLSFEQPAEPEVVDRPLIEVLMEQFGPTGQPPAAFVPAAPAVV